jgi:predicted DsbA family dithiol-disulfide isomerase
MGPRWMEVGRISGMPIDPRIWEEDPPASSYPACVAVKAAELQGGQWGERYLRRLREGVMRERRNIARREVLVEIARELAGDPHNGQGFDAEGFEREVDSGVALERFREDLRDTSYRRIGRFPTLIVRAAGSGEGVIIVGYRPYELLRAAIEHVAPAAFDGARQATNVSEYAEHWERTTAREIAEACGVAGVGNFQTEEVRWSGERASG